MEFVTNNYLIFPLKWLFFIYKGIAKVESLKNTGNPLNKGF